MPTLCPKCNKNFMIGSMKVCFPCAAVQEDSKLRSDLLTAFGGKGKRGLLQFLKIGNFLKVCSSEADTTLYNDRLQMIEKLVGSSEGMELLLAKFVDSIIEIAGAGIQESEDDNEPAT